MLTTALSLLLASLPPGSLVANVNDLASPGTLGDSLLSLDEAIRLANGTLALAQLSAAEAAQVTGTGTTVSRIVVDPTVTPTITLGAATTPVSGGPLTIEGLLLPGPSGTTLQTLVYGGAHAHILAVRTHLVEIRGLHFDGGQLGVDAHTSGSGLLPGQMAVLEDCEFHGQTTASVKVHGAGTDQSALMLHHCHFHNVGLAYLVDDQTSFGWTMVESEHCHLENVVRGADVVMNGRGNMSMWMFFRGEASGGTNFLRVRRTAGSTQQLMIRIVHCDITTSGDVVDVQGIAGGLTMVHHHHSDFRAGPGAKAMFVWPNTADFDFHGSEMHFVGDVAVAAGLFTQRVWQQNNHYENGTLTFDTSGSLPNFLWNRYTNCAIVVPSGARTAVRIRSSHLDNTTLNGQSLLAPITLQGCFRSGGSLSGQATETSPAPARFLGTTTVAPQEPPLGTPFDLTTDLPAGIGAVWDVAISFERPNNAVEPFRFYGDPLTIVVVSGIVQGQNLISVTVPNNPALVGFEVYFQAIAIPLLGQGYAPAYHLPRGGLIRPLL